MESTLINVIPTSPSLSLAAGLKNSLSNILPALRFVIKTAPQNFF
jgi:hypothetical protein